MQIVILGAHGSGTSLLAGVLQAMGCQRGLTDGPSKQPEQRAVVALNDDLLGRIDAAWYDVNAQAFADAVPALGTELDERAHQIVRDMEAIGRPWVLADPRFCITLPFWLRHLERPMFVLAHRDPQGVAASLRASESFPLRASFALWHSHVASALHQTQGHARVVACYEDFVADASRAAERLRSELARIGVTGVSPPSGDEIGALYAAESEPDVVNAEGDEPSAEQQALARALASGSFPELTGFVTLPELEREFFARERRLRTFGKGMAELRNKYGRVEGANVELRQILKRTQSEFRSAERQIGRVEEKLRAASDRVRELQRSETKLNKALQRAAAERHQASAELDGLRRSLEDLQRLAREIAGLRQGDYGLAFLRRLGRTRSNQGSIDELLRRLGELQVTTRSLPEGPSDFDPLGVLRQFLALAEAWKIEEDRLSEQLRATHGLPGAGDLFVRVGTLYAGEAEYEQCKRSIERQTYKRIEHVFYEHLSKKDALSTLMEGFLQSSADILIKIDADMVVLDEDFVGRVVRIFATNPDVQVVQMAMLDFFSGDLMQGVNAYRQGVPWRTDQQDSLFTDRVKVDPKRRLVTWTTFADASIHCPNPSPFQAFHYGVHRGLKVVQPDRATHDQSSAEEQLIYLEKTYEHWRTRRDRRLGFAVLGFELALTEPASVEHLTYQNPYLRERFREFEDWDVARIAQEIEALRRAPAVAQRLEPLRRQRQASLARHTAPVNRIVMLVPHLGMFGGVNRFLYLACAFTRWGVDVAVAIPDGELTGTKRPNRRDDFPDVRVMPLSQAICEDWDVVVCGDRSSGVLLTMPFFRSRLSVVYLLNGWAHRLFNTRQIAAVRPDVVLACSSYAGRQYSDLAPTVVAGGVSLELFAPDEGARSPGAVARIGAYPGRGREAKRFDDTLAACRVLHQRGVPFELHVYDPVLSDLSDTFPIVNHGALFPADVCGVMKQLDVFISSEEDAGWCNPAAEAMASGVPLVCTEAGTTDFAIDGETALVVPPRSPEQIADGVVRLLEDRELASRLRKAGLERIREFDWSNVARRLLETFRAARKDATLRAASNTRAQKELAELGVIS